jgi:uncharacterized iron-regulated membrane protein
MIGESTSPPVSYKIRPIFPASGLQDSLAVSAIDYGTFGGGGIGSDGMQMNIVTRWLRQPQRVWLRRAIFQVHLWTGLAIGLYVVVLSLTGSLLVYRAELSRFVASPRATLDERATPMTVDQLRAAAERAYPGWTITEVQEGRYRARASSGDGRGGPRRPPDPTASIVLERDRQKKERLFNPYTGADLGDYITQGERSLLWMVRLHDDLLLERPNGPWWNGVLSLVFTAIVLTGVVVWWPGVSRWKRSLGVKVTAGGRRFTWDLHSALGFWLFFFMTMWGISGWYLGMPEPLTNLVELISDPEGPYGERPGDIALEWLPRLHFGRWRDPDWGPWLKALWAIVGVVPAVMFVTGLLMWWNRVVRKRRSAPEVVVAEPITAAPATAGLCGPTTLDRAG